MSEPLLVYMTAGSEAEAQAIAQALVTRKQAACVNILPGMISVYEWQDQVETASEVVLLAKTTADYMEPLKQTVTELHSYDVPCLVAMPLTDGLPDYLAWAAAALKNR